MGKPFGSIEKAFDILFLFNSECSEFSASEISDKLGMPLSSTYRYLEILAKKNILTKRVDTKKFTLGPSILKLGMLAGEKISLAGIAHPFMAKLAAKTNETVILTMVHGLEAICVDTIESNQLVRLSMKPGGTIPLHAGSTSKVLLAYLSESTVNEVIEFVGLEKINKNTITDPSALKRELQLIRNNGYAQSESEVDFGAASIAAPIFDYTNEIIAGLTIAGPSDRMKTYNPNELASLVCDSARRVSLALGSSQKNQG
jgi:IclR family KDG regulon transcriptional repressor